MASTSQLQVPISSSILYHGIHSASATRKITNYIDNCLIITHDDLEKFTKDEFHHILNVRPVIRTVEHCEGASYQIVVFVLSTTSDFHESSYYLRASPNVECKNYIAHVDKFIDDRAREAIEKEKEFNAMANDLDAMANDLDAIVTNSFSLPTSSNIEEKKVNNLFT